MHNEPNKPIVARELTEKELEGVVGGKENVAEPGLEGARKVWLEFAEPELACLK